MTNQPASQPSRGKGFYYKLKDFFWSDSLKIRTTRSVEVILLGGAVCYVPWLTSDALTPDYPWYKVYLVLLGIFLLLAHIVVSVKKDAPECVKGVTVFFVIVFVCIIGFVAWKRQQAKPIPDLVRPYLEPTLVVDLVSSNRVLCHYKIHNLSKTAPAYNVLLQEGGEGFLAAQFEPVVTELAPDGTASCDSMGNFGPTTIKAPFFVRNISLTYQGSPGPRWEGFASSFKFLVNSELLKPGEFPYEVARRSEVTNVIQGSIAEVNRVMLQVARTDVSFPGMSANYVLRLGIPVTNRDNFIWDEGEQLDRDRISLYVDPAHNLCFRVLDQNGKRFEAKAAPGNDTFEFGTGLYLRCEFGTTNGFSFIRLVVNGKQLAEDRQSSAIGFSHPWNKFRMVMGADLMGTNGGVFDLVETWICSKTMDSQTAAGALGYESERMKTNRSAVVFSGNQWLETRAREQNRAVIQEIPHLDLRSMR